MKRKLLLFLLSALGFSTACDHEKEGKGPMEMYGTPRIDFRVQGKVTDRAGNPVPNIEVTAIDNRESVRTAADGSYDMEGNSSPSVVGLFFTDTDGPDNGGEFEAKELPVEFTEADRTGKPSGSWNIGSFARENVNVVLEEKAAEQ